MHNSCLERKCFNRQHLCFFFPFFELLSLSTTSYGTEYCLITCCSCVLPASCSPPAHSLGEQSGRKKKPWLCKYYSTIAKTLLCYQHCLVTKSKHSTTLAPEKKVTSVPARPGTGGDQLKTRRLTDSFFSIWQFWVDACCIKRQTGHEFSEQFSFSVPAVKIILFHLGDCSIENGRGDVWKIVSSVSTLCSLE